MFSSLICVLVGVSSVFSCFWYIKSICIQIIEELLLSRLYHQVGLYHTFDYMYNLFDAWTKTGSVHLFYCLSVVAYACSLYQPFAVCALSCRWQAWYASPSLIQSLSTIITSIGSATIIAYRELIWPTYRYMLWFSYPHGYVLSCLTRYLHGYIL